MMGDISAWCCELAGFAVFESEVVEEPSESLV